MDLCWIMERSKFLFIVWKQYFSSKLALGYYCDVFPCEVWILISFPSGLHSFFSNSSDTSRTDIKVHLVFWTDLFIFTLFLVLCCWIIFHLRRAVTSSLHLPQPNVAHGLFIKHIICFLPKKQKTPGRWLEDDWEDMES